MKFRFINKNILALPVNSSIYLMLTIITFLLISCGSDNEDTTVEVEDPDRHYFSIPQGQDLEMVYEIENTGEAPLQIENILPSCGCIIVKNVRKYIPPGETSVLILTYSSTKNVGLVNHQIYIYGNILAEKEEDKWIELSFDVHVVPDGDYTKDYEELYQEVVDKQGVVERSQNPDSRAKKYYVK